MKDLVMRLAREVAPAGTERALQATLIEEVKNVADETYIDTLGNGIIKKHGEGPHIMLAAHADETGVMAIDIDDKGFLRLISIGNISAVHLIHRQVQFTNGVRGLIELEESVKAAEATFDHLYVDIGASSKEEALERAFIGLSGALVGDVFELGEHRLAGRALDNRAGCAIAIEAFKQLAAQNKQVTLVFTAQSEVGGRGARTAAYQVQPDLALIIDGAPASDVPGGKRTVLELGKGPAVKIMDGTAVVPLDVKNHLIQAAANQSIPIQYEVWPLGQSDAGAVQLSVDGIRIGGVSYPARYVASSEVVVDLNDITKAVLLVVEASKTFQIG